MNFIEPLKENYLLDCYLILALGGCLRREKIEKEDKRAVEELYPNR
jgi:hypothetical protein